MNVSLAFLQECAAEHAFDIATLEKVIHLGALAGEIARHPLLGKVLALKGGTALNLCVGAGPLRLSVDLDYNYIGSPERAQMEAERPAIEDAIQKLVTRLGFRVQHSKPAHAGGKLYAYYPSVLGGNSRVEVDLNYLWRVPLTKVREADLWQPGGLDKPRIRTVSLYELCVGKFLAFLDRSAPRDVFDLIVLGDQAHETLRSPLFRALFIALSGTLPHPLNTYSKVRIEQRVTQEGAERQLLPMLEHGTDLASDEIVDVAWEVMAPFVRLADHETAYVNEIAVGSLRAELLFPEDPEIAQRIAGHPALLWKIENVLKERARRYGPQSEPSDAT